MSTFQTGYGGDTTTAYQPAWSPVIPISQTSYTYAADQAGLILRRSNNGSDMTDTMPVPSTTIVDNEPFPINNGWYITIANSDPAGTLTITAATGTTIDGGTNVVINPGEQLKITSDGTNFFSPGSVSQTGSAGIIQTGASFAYTGASQGLYYLRSNAGSAMTDSIVNANTLSNTFYFWVQNTDSVASITITPTGSTINGASSYTLPAGSATRIQSNGTNYYASYSPVVNNTNTQHSSGITVNYTAANNGQTFLRENSNLGMNDTLPNANTMPANFVLWIMSTDGSAAITLTPSGCLINGGANLSIAHNKATRVVTDQTNYFATTPT